MLFEGLKNSNNCLFHASPGFVYIVHFILESKLQLYFNVLLFAISNVSLNSLARRSRCRPRIPATAKIRDTFAILRMHYPDAMVVLWQAMLPQALVDASTSSGDAYISTGKRMSIDRALLTWNKLIRVPFSFLPFGYLFFIIERLFPWAHSLPTSHDQEKTTGILNWLTNRLLLIVTNIVR